MKMKKRSKQIIAWCMLLVLCISPVFQTGATVQAGKEKTSDNSHVLQNPFIEAEEGQVVWDCVYFGNYWQSRYITQSGSAQGQGEDDVVHEDEDGTKYLVREDGKCYKYEPIKWRVLSVSEDGTDAFLMADQSLDYLQFDSGNNQDVTWENSSVREWLSKDFANAAFPADEEKEAIKETEIANNKNPNAAEDMEDGANTTDKIYLPSVEEVTTRAYGFIEGLEETETRKTTDTDFAKSGGTFKGDATGGYLLRTSGVQKGYVSHVDYGIGTGNIPTAVTFSSKINDENAVRPVLHLDLTKPVWTYAGQVKQDMKAITQAPPVSTPTPQPSVTMAPGQVYPKNPVVDAKDFKNNTWDCIYFGQYYKNKFTPSVLSEAGDNDTIQTDEEGNQYLVRHEQGYFYYEPIKWRVLSINQDGTDAFLMADQILDVQPYYSVRDVEITWEKSDIRKWLDSVFVDRAFSDEEKEVIRDSEVKTANNKWFNEQPGGSDTTDKVYLLSIEEALEPSYGFSSDETEGNTRKVTATDYAVAEEIWDWSHSFTTSYWLRSPGSKKGKPAIAYDDGTIPTGGTSDNSTYSLGVRPVMHVDLSNTKLWSYAGKVTPKGVVAPTTPAEPTKNPDSNLQSPAPDKNSQPTVAPKVKKPGKPAIKKLKNTSGKKVTVTLSKKVSGAKGYQVAYATKSSMKGQKKKFFTGTKVTVKGLKKKKTYYFRVRAYTKQDGKKVYGSWSAKKKIKVKK